MAINNDIYFCLKNGFIYECDNNINDLWVYFWNKNKAWVDNFGKVRSKDIPQIWVEDILNPTRIDWGKTIDYRIGQFKPNMNLMNDVLVKFGIWEFKTSKLWRSAEKGRFTKKYDIA